MARDRAAERFSVAVHQSQLSSPTASLPWIVHTLLWTAAGEGLLCGSVGTPYLKQNRVDRRQPYHHTAAPRPPTLDRASVWEEAILTSGSAFRGVFVGDGRKPMATR
jgi:hypothetical protein